MLTGRMPLGKFSLPSELNRDLPSEIDPVVLRCLATEPAGRPATVGQLLEEIDKLEELLRFQLLDELKGLRRGTSALFHRGSTSFKRHPILLVALGLLLLALAGVGGWLLFSQPESREATATAPADAKGATESPTAPVASAATEVAGSSPTAATDPSTTPAVAAPAPPPVASEPGASEPASANPAPSPTKPAAATPRPAEPAPAPAKPAPVRPGPDPALADLEVARGKYDARLYDQALADARAVIEKFAGSPAAIDAYFLVARSQEKLGRTNDALGTFVEIQSRFRGDAKVAEAAFQQARLVHAADPKRAADEARRLYGEMATAYPASPWSARALAARAEIERAQKLNVRDTVLGVSVPAALVTYRQLTQSFPGEASAEKAWWELGQMYEDLKKWELAAAAYSELAVSFPKTRYDAWYQAAEIYERRLKDAAKARQAYGMVPATSPRSRDAQKKLER
jgi:TolA-binding protein